MSNLTPKYILYVYHQIQAAWNKQTNKQTNTHTHTHTRKLASIARSISLSWPAWNNSLAVQNFHFYKFCARRVCELRVVAKKVHHMTSSEHTFWWCPNLFFVGVVFAPSPFRLIRCPLTILFFFYILVGFEMPTTQSYGDAMWMRCQYYPRPTCTHTFSIQKNLCPP